MLSPPTPPRADSMFEEGIVDDSGTQGVGPWCAHALFCSGVRWRGWFWSTRPISFVPENTNDVQALAEATKQAFRDHLVLMGTPQGSGNHILNVLIPTHVQGDPEVGGGQQLIGALSQGCMQLLQAFKQGFYVTVEGKHPRMSSLLCSFSSPLPLPSFLPPQHTHSQPLSTASTEYNVQCTCRPCPAAACVLLSCSA